MYGLTELGVDLSGKSYRRSLRKRCVEHLREVIVSGVLKPGEHIKETQLSEKLGISRGTLREAIRQIEIEGIIENDGRGHMMVLSLSSRQRADVFGVRTALEILAASKLAASDRRVEFAERRG